MFAILNWSFTGLRFAWFFKETQRPLGRNKRKGCTFLSVLPALSICVYLTTSGTITVHSWNTYSTPPWLRWNNTYFLKSWQLQFIWWLGPESLNLLINVPWKPRRDEQSQELWALIWQSGCSLQLPCWWDWTKKCNYLLISDNQKWKQHAELKNKVWKTIPFSFS